MESPKECGSGILQFQVSEITHVRSNHVTLYTVSGMWFCISLRHGYQYFGSTHYLHLLPAWRWRQYVSVEHWELSVQHHILEGWVLTSVAKRTSYLMYIIWFIVLFCCQTCRSNEEDHPDCYWGRWRTGCSHVLDHISEICTSSNPNNRIWLYSEFHNVIENCKFAHLYLLLCWKPGVLKMAARKYQGKYA